MGAFHCSSSVVVVVAERGQRPFIHPLRPWIPSIISLPFLLLPQPTQTSSTNSPFLACSPFRITSHLQSYRVPFDPRVLRFRPSSTSSNAPIMRPLLQLVQRQHAALVALPARIRQARKDMEKKLEEVNKRLEIFSELNDAYQALIDKLKGEQRNQTQKIERLQSMLEQFEQRRPSRSSLEDEDSAAEAVPEQQLLSNGGRATTEDETAARVVEHLHRNSIGNHHHHHHHQSISIVTIDGNNTTEEQQGVHGERMEECVGDVEDQDQDQSQLETEIIYDFVA